MDRKEPEKKIWIPERLQEVTGKGRKEKSVFLITCRELKEQAREEILQRSSDNNLLTGEAILDEQSLTYGAVSSASEHTAQFEELLLYLCRNWVDEVYVALKNPDRIPDEILEQIVDMGIQVRIRNSGRRNLKTGKEKIETEGNLKICSICLVPQTAVGAFFKRAFDISAALVGCVFAALIIVILAPFIWVQSPGPILFRQTRVGKNGKLFDFYKIRTMYPDAEKRKAELMKQNEMEGPIFKLTYDPRIIGTKKLPDGTVKHGIGNFIREYSLDEFPQFFNVLKGDMSIVGTRPPTLDEWNQYKPHHRARLAMKPGITGLWQVSGRNDIRNFEEVVKLDRKYMKEWSPLLDLKIFFKTISVVLKKTGAL
ncbi:MAG: sugar transferase [Lachnospiraceae bacterium]|nr:sugar transferase [Lachnospiraceae bacterium]